MTGYIGKLTWNKRFCLSWTAEWAEEFFDLYNHPTVTAEDIANKNYNEVDYLPTINEKFACVASLLSATEDQVGECRKFIRQYCDPEYLSVYDIYWAGNDDRRLKKLAK